MTVVVDKGVQLQCQANVMMLTFDPLVLPGLTLDDLVPLKSDCVGYNKSVEDGQFVFRLPLSDCGANIEVGWPW